MTSKLIKDSETSYSVKHRTPVLDGKSKNKSKHKKKLPFVVMWRTLGAFGEMFGTNKWSSYGEYRNLDIAMRAEKGIYLKEMVQNHETYIVEKI